MRLHAAILTILASACLLTCHAQRTTRPGRVQAARTAAERMAQPAADTIVPTSGAVVIAGYDKTLSSRRESFFVTNAADSATLVWILATIDYLDMQGHQLHRRRATMRCDIPPRQTRRLDIPAWDRQGVYYYRGSEPRRRVQAAASPFEISIRIDSVAVRR